jgi:hypothetical protein
MYYRPGRLCQSTKWYKPACETPQGVPYYVHTKRNQMTEILDLQTLALLDSLEADLEVPDFDADELLDDEA